MFIESPSGLQSAFRSETERVFSTLLVQPDVISSTGGRLAPSTLYTAYRIQDVKAAIDFAGFRVRTLREGGGGEATCHRVSFAYLLVW